jgi:hypothetical protein
MRPTLEPCPGPQQEAADGDLHGDDEEAEDEYAGDHLDGVETVGDQPRDGADLGEPGTPWRERDKTAETFDGRSHQHNGQRSLQPDRAEAELQQDHLRSHIGNTRRKQPAPGIDQQPAGCGEPSRATVPARSSAPPHVSPSMRPARPARWAQT